QMTLEEYENVLKGKRKALVSEETCNALRIYVKHLLIGNVAACTFATAMAIESSLLNVKCYTRLSINVKPHAPQRSAAKYFSNSKVPAASVTTIALSTTFASASSIPPISTDDYEIVGADGQEGAGTDGQAVADGNVAPFPNVDDVELNIPQ
ncbi:hypothetical protein Tco_1073864, partial [Tanacetum coccineum]